MNGCRYGNLRSMVLTSAVVLVAGGIGLLLTYIVAKLLGVTP